ncbi:MAG: superoxide dismutase [Polyangiaceae bacterium]|nr:superoxide dismutase [Polyangiaceae bacterium]
MTGPTSHAVDACAHQLPRRAAVQGLVAVGGLLFLPMQSCGGLRPPGVVAPPPPNEQEFPMANEYTLPKLPYSYEALEPYVDAQTVKLHHDMHHAGYVNGANAALKELEAARKSGDFKLVDHWSKKLAFHASGHLLHSLYWDNMAPQGKGGAPSKELTAAITSSFGNLDAMKAQLSAAAKLVEGSGWGVVGFNTFDQSLTILQAENHEKKAIWSVIPLLVVDVWEHAYYLKYQNKRADYVDAWWNVVSWDDVSKRFAKASMLKALK